MHLLGYNYMYLILNKLKWNNCSIIKQNREFQYLSFLAVLTDGLLAHTPWPVNQSKFRNWNIIYHGYFFLFKTD